MHDALRRSRGLATVSSTAALEAIAMNRPTLIISDFGVSAEMINLVFEGQVASARWMIFAVGDSASRIHSGWRRTTSIRPKRTTGWTSSTTYLSCRQLDSCLSDLAREPPCGGECADAFA